MATFQSADDVYKIFGTFLAELTQEPEMRPKFVAANTSFLVNYTDPDSKILVDCTCNPPTVVTDPPADATAEIKLNMSADDGHKFWLGKLNMTVALARKQVKVSGPMAKMMKLLPALKPGFAKYRTYLEQNGYTDKLL